MTGISLERRRTDTLSAACVAIHCIVVFAPVYLAAYLGPGWWTPMCWAWFGILGHGLLLLLHECIHRLTFRRTWANEALAYCVLAPLFLTDFAALRARHWAHHRHLGGPADPKRTYRESVRGWRIAWLVLETLLLVGAARKARLQAGEQSEVTPTSRRNTIVGIAVVQGLFAASLLATARWSRGHDWRAILTATGVAYFGVYVYGVASWTVLLHTLRGVAEHQPLDPAEVRHGEAAVRNFEGGLAERWVWGPYGFVEHATHHRHPALPAYALARVTRSLATRDQTLRPAGSHFTVLWRLVRARDVVSMRSP